MGGADRSRILNRELGSNWENRGFGGQSTGTGKESKGQDVDASKDGDPQEL